MLKVIKNLLISKIEIRAEDSIDIKQYVHTRSVDKVVVKLTEQILNLREKYFNVSVATNCIATVCICLISLGCFCVYIN